MSQKVSVILTSPTPQSALLIFADSIFFSASSSVLYVVRLTAVSDPEGIPIGIHNSLKQLVISSSIPGFDIE
jgi:hypothetical protein